MRTPSAQAQILADELLFPAAIEVDRTGAVPDSHWDRLAADGFYALAAPPEVGGPGLQFPEILAVVETMAGGCLATTFTWIQHHGVVLGLAGSPNAALREELLADLAAGRVRGGVAFAGVVPDPPRMTAVRTDGGWLLSGIAPFVSGWGIVHVLQISTGDVETGDVVHAIVPAQEQPGMTVQPLELVAADATSTVMLRVENLFVPDEKVVAKVPRKAFLAGLTFGGRINAAVPTGLVRRCIRLLGDSPVAKRFQDDLDAVVARLDASLADPPTMLPARTAINELALRAAAALVTAGGGPSLLRTAHAQRLAREALFTLVAASRPELKQALLQRLAGDA